MFTSSIELKENTVEMFQQATTLFQNLVKTIIIIWWSRSEWYPVYHTDNQARDDVNTKLWVMNQCNH